MGLVSILEPTPLLRLVMPELAEAGLKVPLVRIAHAWQFAKVNRDKLSY